MMIGIDGGGTKTEFVLFSERGKIKKRIKLSKSNPNDIGLQECYKVLTEGIDVLLECESEVNCIFAGIAGGRTGDNAKKISDFLKNQYPSIKIKVDTDAVNLISCGNKAMTGMALICGTGSVLFARENGVMHQIGGWGYLFDESGSAYDVGKDAIRAVLAEQDGLGEKTMLTELLWQKLQKNIWDSLNEIYTKGKSYIASFAPVVFTAASHGDEVAKKIIQKNAEHLARLICTAINNYECGKEVVVGGGMFENCKDVLLPIIKQLVPYNIQFVFPALPPVYGACVECCNMMGIIPDEDFYNTFYNDYI